MVPVDEQKLRKPPGGWGTMMKKRRISIVSLALLTFWTGPANADFVLPTKRPAVPPPAKPPKKAFLPQRPDAPSAERKTELQFRVDPAQVSSILTSMGYRVESVRDEAGAPYLNLHKGSSSWSLVFDPCTRPNRCRQLAFSAKWQSSRKPGQICFKYHFFASSREAPYCRAVEPAGEVSLAWQRTLDDGPISDFDYLIRYYVGQWQAHVDLLPRASRCSDESFANPALPC